MLKNFSEMSKTVTHSSSYSTKKIVLHSIIQGKLTNSVNFYWNTSSGAL